jgi:hypothetical protein
MKLFIKTKNKYIQLIQGTFVVQKETYNIKIIIDSKIVLPIVSKTKISVKTKRTKKKKRGQEPKVSRECFREFQRQSFRSK